MLVLEDRVTVEQMSQAALTLSASLAMIRSRLPHAALARTRTGNLAVIAQDGDGGWHTCGIVDVLSGQAHLLDVPLPL
ncbi:MAG: hypothetical protein ABWY93_22630 [Mycobacterium sp.]